MRILTTEKMRSSRKRSESYLRMRWPCNLWLEMTSLILSRPPETELVSLLKMVARFSIVVTAK
jgi:hypothetical protein